MGDTVSVGSWGLLQTRFCGCGVPGAHRGRVIWANAVILGSLGVSPSSVWVTQGFWGLLGAVPQVQFGIPEVFSGCTPARLDSWGFPCDLSLGNSGCGVTGGLSRTYPKLSLRFLRVSPGSVGITLGVGPWGSPGAVPQTLSVAVGLPGPVLDDPVIEGPLWDRSRLYPRLSLGSQRSPIPQTQLGGPEPHLVSPRMSPGSVQVTPLSLGPWESLEAVPQAQCG